MNISSLLEQAREKSGATSGRSLARAIGLTHTEVRRLLSGQCLPSEDTMLSIASVAGVPEDEALLLLNIWRSTGRVSAIYGKLHKGLIAARPPPKAKKRETATQGEQIAR